MTFFPALLAACCVIAFNVPAPAIVHSIDIQGSIEPRIIMVADEDGDGDLRPECDRALRQALPGSTIQLPAGQYEFNGVAEFRCDDVRVLGAGTVLAFPTTGANRTQPSHGFYANRRSGLTVREIRFVGRGRVNETAIYWRSVARSIVERCTFDSIGFSAVNLTSTFETRPQQQDPGAICVDNIVCDNLFRGSSGLGVFLFGGTKRTRVSGNRFINVRRAIQLDDATVASIPPYLPCVDNVVSENVIIGSSDIGIDLEGANGNVVTSNIVSKCGIGIAILSFQHGTPSDSNMVTGNLIRESTHQGLTIRGGRANLITGNAFIRNGEHSVALSVSDSIGGRIASVNNVISRNQISGSTFGIFINDLECDHNEISGNTFESVPGADVRRPKGATSTAPTDRP